MKSQEEIKHETEFNGELDRLLCRASRFMESDKIKELIRVEMDRIRKKAIEEANKEAVCMDVDEAIDQLIEETLSGVFDQLEAIKGSHAEINVSTRSLQYVAQTIRTIDRLQRKRVTGAD